VRSALEWARVRALAADGLSQREIARRLAINRRTVARLAASEEPPRYRRAPAGSQLDRFEPVLRRLLEEWPQIKAPRATELSRADYGYSGSVDLVRRRLRELRPRTVRPAQRTGYRPGQVQQLDWTELPTRPRVAGRERRVYALVASLPYSGAQTAFFSFDMTIESFLEGPRAGVRVARGRAARVRLRQPSLGRRPPRGGRGGLESTLPALARPLRLPCNRLHAGGASEKRRRRALHPRCARNASTGL
jgi:transposase